MTRDQCVAKVGRQFLEVQERRFHEFATALHEQGYSDDEVIESVKLTAPLILEDWQRIERQITIEFMRLGIEIPDRDI
jgi:hypothetical protein